ncbi:MAG: hypothetical protein K0Q65_449 [Clostridia bacterium]|jgi:hypothetical protein|nr:hypothetical protein [Clostridia bacterium]
MKKILNVLIILSVLLTPHLVVQAYEKRGYVAFGGEWLIVPLVIAVAYLVEQVKALWRECSNDTWE